MKILFIDNCVWDILYKNKIDIQLELGDIFEIKVSGTGEREIPDKQNPEVALYARDQLSKTATGGVQQWFGFSSKKEGRSFSPNTGGFGSPFMTKELHQKTTSYPKKIGGETGTKKTKSGLLKNQTDAFYNGCSQANFPLLTANIKDFEPNGKVIDILIWNEETESLRDFVKAQLRLKGFNGNWA